MYNYKIFYQNVNGARSKTHTLYTIFLNANYDFICLTETNFNISVYDRELIDDRYTIFRRDRDTTCINKYKKLDGGGVLIAIKKESLP